MAVDISKEEVRVLINHINSCLYHFRNSTEKKFWEKTYKIKELKNIRDKLLLYR
jgi:hypothetical protein